jgi:CheY-like chemotaxis protein
MNKRVLICDDDADFLSVYKLALEETGMNVFTRPHCRQILEIVKEVKPDVILMDNWIPDAGGIVTTRVLKNHPSYKNIPVIYISANPDIKILAHEAGADFYLSKPFNVNELTELLSSFSD